MSARRSDGVVIVDLGTGNLGNLERALAMAGGAPRVSTDPAVVAAARCLVLPGVGAFRPARERLRGPLEAALRAALASGASLLGICLGYQLLFDGSDEDGETDGLGLLPGRVRRLADLVDGGRVPVPQVGWNRVTRLRPHPVLDAMAGAAAYFVHSYAPEEVPEPLRLATTWHGRELLSAAARGRVVGTQFHPELSGDAGQRLLRRFLETAAAADTGGDSQRPVATAPAPAVAMVEGGPVPFELFPALDLRQGKVVRLLRGDDAQRTVYGDDPLAVAAAFARAGAGWLHVVDLDAAFGEAPQEALLGALLAMPHRPRVQLAGGLRSAAAIERALALGAERAVVGSLAVREPAAFRALAAAHPGRLVPALDVDGGRVLAAGWRERGPRWEEAAAALRGVPCPALLVTVVARDGTLAGPDLELTTAVGAAAGLPALVSGGVRSLADLRAAAARPGLAGAIAGRALYDGAFTVEAALAALAAVGREPVAQGPVGLMARVIPCLDVAGGRVVKGVRFRDLVDQGDPAAAARRYQAQGADELVFLDVGAAPERRDTAVAWVEAVARELTIPLTVGGGVRSVDDALALLRAGADKVGVNSAAVARPALLAEIAARCGRQCVVLSVDAARRVDIPPLSPRPPASRGAGGATALPLPLGTWEVFTHGGRQASGREAITWIEEGVALGAGEILLTSMDGDGTRGGYDLELLRAAAARVGVPVIASGGAGSVADLARALDAGAAAVLAASLFHQGDLTVREAKLYLAARGFAVRLDDLPAAVAAPLACDPQEVSP